MDIRVIYDPLLRQKAETISVFDANLKKQADEMIVLMQKNRGIGLSGNQVGLKKRLIVFGYKNTGKDDNLPDVPFQQLCNPKIVKYSKELETMEEGCLSLPGLELPVERPAGVTVEAQTLDCKPITIKAKGLHARIMQHEIDHLDGILFTDRVKNYKKIQDYQFARILFCGTDDFSLVVLKGLVEAGYNVVSVVTETAKPSGRGQKLVDPNIKTYAKSQEIAVFQPEDKERLTYVVNQLKPDLLVLASYGKILPQEALSLPVFGCINVHPSLLPKYRGATPIQTAILNGDKITGVTIMEMVPDVDAGGIIAQEQLPIEPEDTTPILKNKLANKGSSLLVKTIPSFLSGQAKLTGQKSAEATKTTKLTKEMAEIDWGKSAAEIDRQIRALNPWPGAYTMLGEKRLKFLESTVSDQLLKLKVVQLEGKNPAVWNDFKKGYAQQLTKEPWYCKISQ